MLHFKHLCISCLVKYIKSYLVVSTIVLYYIMTRADTVKYGRMNILSMYITVAYPLQMEQYYINLAVYICTIFLFCLVVSTIVPYCIMTRADTAKYDSLFKSTSTSVILILHYMESYLNFIQIIPQQYQLWYKLICIVLEEQVSM